MKKTFLLESTLATLAYSAIFQYPLTNEELFNRLIGVTTSDKKQLFETLHSTSLVTKERGFLVLQKSSASLKTREEREQFSKGKWKEVATLLSILKKIPTISSVYVTGSLAMNNVHSIADDIDLLVVTIPGTLWFTRMLVVLWTTLIGKYRLHGSSGEWGWCFNLWLDQRHLEIPKKKRSVYSAYEVIQATLVLGTQNELINANRWIKGYINYSDADESHNYYGTRIERDENHLEMKKSCTAFFKKVCIGVVSLFDLPSYYLQRLYMSPRRSTESIDRGFAFFHPRDTRSWVLFEWLRMLEKVGFDQEQLRHWKGIFSEGKSCCGYNMEQ